MKTSLCKISVFLLLTALLLPSLLACSAQPDEEVLAAAEALLQESATVNALCFGEGLSPMEEGGFTSGGYAEADVLSLGKYGVTSVADIRARVSAIYSVAAVQQVEDILFSPVQSEGAYAAYRRYYDTVTEDGRALLMVKREYTPLTRGTVCYENVRLAENTRNRAVILVDITVTDGERERTLTDERFTLRYEENGWRLDTLTYASID